MKNALLLMVFLFLFGCAPQQPLTEVAKPVYFDEFDVDTSIQRTIYNINEKYRKCIKMPSQLNALVLDAVGFAQLTIKNPNTGSQMHVEFTRVDDNEEKTRVKFYSATDKSWEEFSVFLMRGAKGLPGCTKEGGPHKMPQLEF
jgi:hypothetical protein